MNTHTMKGLTFFPVPEFQDVAIAFGADRSCFFDRNDLPDVPAKYERMANTLFFKGGELPKFLDGVDREKAKRALTAWLSSFAPAHEAKIATAGYALWLWTEGGTSE